MANLEPLKTILANGGVVVLPTETVYGLFARALDQKAVQQVYTLKGRPTDKAMNLNVASYQDILAYSQDQPSYLRKLYQTFLPGPLTIILKANDRVPVWVNFGLDTVGFRLSKSPCHSRIDCRIWPPSWAFGQFIWSSIWQDFCGYYDRF
ncbi:Sua5/YciO/YrdC/YwlC family protein [Streptococcus sobrinus DSM 20742 = ATCC 33478]|nr:Sua5/YciO/YrdC/YwlC family protein [Streptococcus sobrinus DSM 20742 = ATCC 33478]